jgi:phosphoesterase RecJ-like protein
MRRTTKSDLNAARDRIAAARRALVITHVNPDGDAIGSVLGFGLALRAAGKEVVFACADPAPDLFAYLPSFGEITPNPAGSFDLIAVLDVSDETRLGKFKDTLGRRPDLLFDHHITNPGFAEINFIDVEAASTAELVTEHLAALGLSLTQPIAECLLTGVVTDTLGFKTVSTTPKTLALAQSLMQAGAPLSKVYDLSLFKRSFAAARLWGEGLVRMKLEDRLVWTSLPLSVRAVSGYYGKDDADLVNVLTSVREADVALIFVERANGTVKVSWRSMSALNVASLAASFGGGGHAPAAGADVPGALAEVEARVIAATRAALRENGSQPG